MADGLQARSVAYHILNDIFFRNHGLDAAIEQADNFTTLEPRDRAFVRLLVLTVLKRARQLDSVIIDALHEPLDALKPQQLINLFRLGLAQYAFLDTPVHAVVNTSVELAAAQGAAHHKGLVNAVMRKLTAQPFAHLDVRDAGRVNTPGWLWQEWTRDYGIDTALDIAAAHLGPAPVDFTVMDNIEHWSERLEADILPTGTTLRRRLAGFVPDLPGYEDGVWWVQGASAALPAFLLGDIRGKTVVDLCAAPGGKTAQLARLGAHVIAVDRSAPRMKRLQDNMLRLGIQVETQVVDGAMWQPQDKVDAVLLDAPCTATGTIRHQPDVLHLKTVKDQDKLVALQRRLLVNALEMLKPGGQLVYCTCSLQKAEGEEQTDWFLQQGLPVNLTFITGDALKGISSMLTPRGDLRCLPTHWDEQGGMDGFYIAVFEKGSPSC